MYFPQGIVAQTEQSQDARIKATAGMALQNSRPMMLSELQKHVPSLESKDIVAYAPVAGLPKLRSLWKKHIGLVNPELKQEHCSLPIVSSGLTHGINLVLSLLLDPEDSVMTQQYLWENYEHIVQTYLQSSLELCPMFDDQGRLQDTVFRQSLRKVTEKTGKAVLLFNFPNNPTGLSPQQEDIAQLLKVLEEEAARGSSIAVICDDAYFGLHYEASSLSHSLFSDLASLHENILAVKIDGATKELLSWGLRVGFVTFGNPRFTEPVLAALEQKMVSLIRATVTSSSRLSQSLVIKMLESESLSDELKSTHAYLRQKYNAVQKHLSALTAENPDAPISPLYYNAGYFMCFHCRSISAEELRLSLLEKEKIALIQIGDLLRFTFASVETEQIPEILDTVYLHAKNLAKNA